MVTTVGTQHDLVDLLQNLITLDYDAIQAYESALDHIHDDKAKHKLREFINDHRRHIDELTPHLTGMGGEVPSGSGAKSLLTQGKVELAQLAGDGAILKAMATNEQDTVTAYERAADRDDTNNELRDKLRQGLEDEQRHKAWIQERA